MAKQDVTIVRNLRGDRNAYLHLNVRVSDTLIPIGAVLYLPSTSKTRLLMEGIMAIKGVQGLSVERYEVLVSRTLAVGWDKILPAVEGLIATACAEGDLVEV